MHSNNIVNYKQNVVQCIYRTYISCIPEILHLLNCNTLKIYEVGSHDVFTTVKKDNLIDSRLLNGKFKENV